MKKVLFFTYDFPFPTTSGGKSRAYNLLKFAGKDVEILLFSFIRSDFQDSYKKEMEKIGVKKIWTFNRKKLKDIKNISSLFSTSSIFHSLYFDKKIYKVFLETIINEKIDVVQYESFYTAFYASREVSQMGVRQIFGTENIEYLIYNDYAKKTFPLLKPFYLWQVKKIKEEEENFYKNVDACLAVTKNETEIINKIGAKKTVLIENGIDELYFSYTKPSKNTSKRILFVGNFSYFPNIDAINFFYKNVFTKLEPDYKLIIIGKKAEILSFKNDPRIQIVEFIEDIRDAYGGADIMVSPLRLGGGTNFKILEAMASGLPVIAHPARLGGLGVASEKHLLTAENGEDFVREIDRLFNDYDLRLSLSKQARLFVQKNYTWEKIGSCLNALWKSL